MAIPGVASSQSRGLSSMSGVSLSGSGTPVSIGNHAPYQASPLHHSRTSSGDGGLMAMQIAHTPQGSRGSRGGGGEEYGMASMSRPIDVPAGSNGGATAGGGGMMPHNLFSGSSHGGGGGGGGGGGHDMMARSMGYTTGRGGAGTSYPPSAGDDAELDSGRAEAFSYSAASFSMGGASGGNFVASDFGYALQRPGLRYEPAYKQSPPAVHSSSQHAGGPPSLFLGRRRVSDVIPGRTQPQPGSSFGNYRQQSEGSRGHERGGRALSMDQSQGAALQYYASGGGGGGAGLGGLGGPLSGGGGRFGPQSAHYPMQQASASVSASTVVPPGYSPLARGTLLGPGPPSAAAAAFRSNAPQAAAVPWVRAGRGIGHSSQPLTGGPRAHSTSPVFGRWVELGVAKRGCWGLTYCSTLPTELLLSVLGGVAHVRARAHEENSWANYRRSRKKVQGTPVRAPVRLCSWTRFVFDAESPPVPSCFLRASPCRCSRMLLCPGHLQ